MTEGQRLVLIERNTLLKGRDDDVTTFVTPAKPVSDECIAEIELGRGPIRTGVGHQARFVAAIEESHDGKTWCRTLEPLSDHDPDVESVAKFSIPIRRSWVRARVEFRGHSVACWAEGELFA